MKKSTIITLVVVALVILVPSCMVMSSYNGMIKDENGIEASHKDTQNVHAAIFQNMKQQGVAVEKYGDMVIEAINVAMSGRYGEGGSKAAWAWIQEQNPSIDAKIFEKLQRVIEAGYNEFKAAQTKKLDRIRIYKDKLRTFPSNMVAGFFGFPKVPLEEYERIVTSAQTKGDFASGELSDPNIFSKPAEKQ